MPYTSGNGTSNGICPIDKCTVEDQNWRRYKCKENSAVYLNKPEDIQTEIMLNGPVETGFEVYEDFTSYKRGIYEYTEGYLLGGHAVKIIGWGKGKDARNKDINYWICQNSWSNKWGESGFFNIKFGEVGIDTTLVVACEPEIVNGDQVFDSIFLQ
jgi:C1A family cysteine protease